MPHGGETGAGASGVEVQDRRERERRARLRAEGRRVGADERGRPRREQDRTGDERDHCAADRERGPVYSAREGNREAERDREHGREEERGRPHRARDRGEQRHRAQRVQPAPPARTVVRRPDLRVGLAGRVGIAAGSESLAGSVARTNAPSTNGASAKHTSGPSSPRQIALRAIGLAAYAAAAAMPGSDEVANGRSSRYAPNAPSGSAPPMTSDCARPGCPSSAAPDADINANSRVSPDAAAPMIVVRHEPVNVDHASPTPGQAWNDPTSGT